MRAPAADLDARAVAEAVTSGWGLPVGGRYVALGGGSHHWAAAVADGTRYFITVDDLLDKPWLGADPDTAFAGLLPHSAWPGLAGAGWPALRPGSAAVAAGRRGAPAHHALQRGGVSVRAGQTGRWGDELNPADRDQILRLLAGLHGATAAVRALAAPRKAEVYERPARLRPRSATSAGPGTAARSPSPPGTCWPRRAGLVAGWLDEFDRLAEHVAAADADLVVTHGEPHGGNIMRVGRELLLIDWDTVALAPPERDLWMLDDGAAGGLAA